MKDHYTLCFSQQLDMKILFHKLQFDILTYFDNCECTLFFHISEMSFQEMTAAETLIINTLCPDWSDITFL